MSETKVEYGIFYFGDELTCPRCGEKYLAGDDHVCVQVCEWDVSVGASKTGCGKYKLDTDWKYCPFCGRPIERCNDA